MRRRESGASRSISGALSALALVAWLSAPPRAEAVEDSNAGDSAAVSSPASNDLTDLSLEQLGNIEVTSVSRRTQRLSETPASIYVITSEDIRRSGVKTIPEALRLAPILQVARADANQYAITARGFNSVLANKLLVMIDGRTVYSPLFSGVFWEAQDLLLEDIDRIEVMTGPGGTSWGTNAVNGVISILTRPATETKGLLASAGAGDDLRVAQARYGWGSGPHFRAYAKYTDHDPSRLTDGTEARDAFERFQGGARARWVKTRNTFVLDGGGYSNDIDQAPEGRTVSGYHLTGTWLHRPPGKPRTELQAYYERTRRDQPGTILDELDTYDVMLHQQFRFGRHGAVWGAGYRYQDDRVDNLGPALAFRPADRVLRYAHVFVEDAIELDPRLEITAGARLERNDYTGWAFLPTLRAAWHPHRAHLLWAAASRAVRAPSRIDREFFSPANPPFVFLAGGADFRSEILKSVELGYRGQPHPALSYSLCAFAGAYDRLRSIEPTPAGPVFGNGLEATVHGAELWASYRARSWWRVSAGGALERSDVDVKPGSADINGRLSLGIDPEHWWSLRSSFDLGPTGELDWMVRQVGELGISRAPNYTTLDGRVAWRFLPTLELSVVGRDLLGPRHPEWGGTASRVAFGRSVFTQLQWRL